MQKLPASALDFTAVISVDPMTDLLDASELLGVQVNHLAGPRPLISNDRRGWL
jgi:hypothetical protein